MKNEPMRGARGMAMSMPSASTRGGEHPTAGKMTGVSMMKDGGKGYGRTKAPDTKHSPGTAAGDSSLGDAVGELHRQHPHPYSDQGPFYSHTSQPDGDGMRKK